MPPVDVAHVRLLAADADLARRLREDDRMEAVEQLIVPALRLTPGPFDVERDSGPRRPFAYLVLAGALLGQTELAGVHALHIVGPGDVVHADAALQLQIATEARVAVLDQSLQLPLATWPGLQVALIERMAAQLDRFAVQQAIAQLPHVEQRIEALFRFLAERWGTLTREGTHVRLALTHEVIGQLVGARRPTVTLALRELAARGVLARRADRSWLLVGTTVAQARPEPPCRAPGGIRFEETADAPLARQARPHWDAVSRAELLDLSRQIQQRHVEQRALVGRRLEVSVNLRARSQRLREDVARTRAAAP